MKVNGNNNAETFSFKSEGKLVVEGTKNTCELESSGEHTKLAVVIKGDSNIILISRGGITRPSLEISIEIDGDCNEINIPGGLAEISLMLKIKGMKNKILNPHVTRCVYFNSSINGAQNCVFVGAYVFTNGIVSDVNGNGNQVHCKKVNNIENNKYMPQQAVHQVVHQAVHQAVSQRAVPQAVHQAVPQRAVPQAVEIKVVAPQQAVPQADKINNPGQPRVILRKFVEPDQYCCVLKHDNSATPKHSGIEFENKSPSLLKLQEKLNIGVNKQQLPRPVPQPSRRPANQQPNPVAQPLNRPANQQPNPVAQPLNRPANLARHVPQPLNRPANPKPNPVARQYKQSPSFNKLL